MRRIFATGLLALSLAACAHQEPSSGAAGMAWSLNEVEGEGLKLAFGEPQSDNVVMMLTCAPRSGAVRVSVNAPAAGDPTLRLTSGRESSQRAGEMGPSGFGDGAVIEAELPAADPVLANFARTGQLAVSAASQRSVLPPARSEAARFVSACRA